MRFFLPILLAFCHLFSTVGFCAEMHECGGASSFTFYDIQIDSDGCECDHDATDHETDCCHSKKVELKADTKANTTFKTEVYKNASANVLFSLKFDYSVTKERVVVQNVLAYGDEYPPGSSPPIYLLQRCFLI